MIEISTSDPEGAKLLRQVAAEDPENIEDISTDQMSGADVVTIVVENWGTLSAGAAGILVALRHRHVKVGFTKDGIAISASMSDELFRQAEARARDPADDA